MPYYDLRFTMSPIFKCPDEDLTPAHHKKIQSVFRMLIAQRINSDAKPRPYTCGLEEGESLYEDQDPDTHCISLHYHFRFFSHDLEPTIRKQIKDRFLKMNLYCHGNSCYKFKTIIPDDINRYYRYCLKQGPVASLTNIPDYDNLVMLAKDEYKNKSKYLNAKKVLKKNKTELYDRLVKYLEEEQLLTDRYDIWARTLAFYDKENRAFNTQSISGHVKRYMWKKKLVTSNELLPNDPFFRK